MTLGFGLAQHLAQTAALTGDEAASSRQASSPSTGS
jgi:hypothetical protein